MSLSYVLGKIAAALSCKLGRGFFRGVIGGFLKNWNRIKTWDQTESTWDELG